MRPAAWFFVVNAFVRKGSSRMKLTIALLATALLAGGVANAAFVTSDPNGGWAEAGYYVHNNMWNSAKYGRCTSTLSASSHDKWQVVRSSLNQMCFGVETVSTDDADATFQVTAFSIDAKLRRRS